MNYLMELITALGRCSSQRGEISVPEMRRLRLQWQLALGIDDSVTGSILTVNNNRFVLIPNMLAIGDPEHSKEQVEYMDNQSDFDDDASKYIGILNKVRKVIVQHYDIANDLSFQDYVTKLLIDDLENYLDDKVPNGINCADKDFLEIYQQKSELLTLSFNENDSKEEIMTLIANTSKTVIKGFLKKKDVIQILEFSRLEEYNQMIIDVMKYVFRRHQRCKWIVEEFFDKTPFFSVLKGSKDDLALEPTSTSLTFQNSHDPSHSTQVMLSKIEIPTVLSILEQICEAEKLNNKNMPITMEYLPKILEYYIRSLNEEGDNDANDDFYIKLFKSYTIKWIDEKITTDEFSKQLADLSLVPSAMPYVYNGIRLPNIHMRKALYDLKEEIRLKDIYLHKWYGASKIIKSLLKLEQKWKLARSAKYWNMMIDNFNQNQDMKVLAINVYNDNLLCKSFSNWIGEMVLLREKEESFNSFYLRKYMNLWKARQKELQFQESKQLEEFQLTKLKVYFKIWRNAKDNQYSDQVLDFHSIQKRNYFTVWTSRFKKRQYLCEIGDNFHNKNLMRSCFAKWTNRSSDTLNKVRVLLETETSTAKRKTFRIWQQKTNLERISRVIVVKRDYIMLEWMFSHYLGLTKLKMRGNMFESELSRRKLDQLFQNWKKQHQMNLSADQLLDENCIFRAFKIWDLKLKERKFKIKRQRAMTAKYLKIWKLMLSFNNFTVDKLSSIKSDCLHIWLKKSKEQLILVSNSENMREHNLKKLYFSIWKSYYQSINALEIKELDFKAKSTVPYLHLKYIVLTWKDKTTAAKLKQEELSKSEKALANEKLQRILFVWRKKYKTIKNNEELSDTRYSNMILEKTFSKWLNRFDSLYERYEQLVSKREDVDVARAKELLGKWAMKLLKIKNDENKCYEFINRWEKQRKLLFWELWKMKPTMRATTEEGIGMNFDLNPFNDVNSALSTPTPLEKRSVTTPRKSPMRQRNENYLLQSVERVRRRELAERIERYKFR